MTIHKEFREKFGNVLPTDNAVEVLEAIEQWLIERESKQLPKRLCPLCEIAYEKGEHKCAAENCPI